MRAERGSIRPAALAGRWYPGDAEALTAAVQAYLAAAPDVVDFDVQAVVAPHAGYIYSGPTTCSSCRRICRTSFLTMSLG